MEQTARFTIWLSLQLPGIRVQKLGKLTFSFFPNDDALLLSITISAVGEEIIKGASPATRTDDIACATNCGIAAI